MRHQDWQHRLTVLRAWQAWCDGNNWPQFPCRDATYRAVLDGCAITLRALCVAIEVSADFRELEKRILSAGGDRFVAMMECCNRGGNLIGGLDHERQRCLLEVLYLGNRAVAHPEDGNLDHQVSPREMTSAINTLLQWLAARRASLPGLADVPHDLFQPIPAPQTPPDS